MGLHAYRILYHGCRRINLIVTHPSWTQNSPDLSRVERRPRGRQESHMVYIVAPEQMSAEPVCIVMRAFSMLKMMTKSR